MKKYNNNAKIKINDNQFKFDLEIVAEKDSFSSVKFNGNASSYVVNGIGDNEYDLMIKKGTESIILAVDNVEEGKIVLTKKKMH